jgi:hypothetical protein
MRRLDHWRADELRELANKFRNHAARTRIEKYVELLSRTADDLEHEAEALEAQRRSELGRHIDICI